MSEEGGSYPLSFLLNRILLMSSPCRSYICAAFLVDTARVRKLPLARKSNSMPLPRATDLPKDLLYGTGLFPYTAAAREEPTTMP